MNLKQSMPSPTRTPPSRANYAIGDPFANYKKSFPVFDDAIRTAHDENTLNEYDTEDNDHSVCSNDSTDMLNLSIGARAALDEHLRHVAKFGIDDSQYVDRNRDESSLFESNEKDPRDLLWQKLVDPNVSHNVTNTSIHLLSRDMLRLLHKATILHSEDLNGEMEDENDLSSDYFNSSRVYMLKTPERNRSPRTNAVTARNEPGFVENSSASKDSPADSFRSNVENQLSFKPNAAKNDDSPNIGVPRDENSFLFSAVDLSCISDDGSEDGQTNSGTPMASRLRERQVKSEQAGDGFLLTRENLQRIRCVDRSPSFRLSKATPTSSLQLYEPSLDPSNLSFGFYQKRSPPNSPQFSRTDDLSDFAQNLTLSPIGLQSRQTTPFKAIHCSTPQNRKSPRSSPSPHDDNISGMLAEYCSTSKGNLDDEFSRLDTSTSKIPGSKDCLTSPNFCNNDTESSSSTTLLRDRRRFRTVVPTRVFFTDSDDFPEQYDSFSVSPTCDGTQKSEAMTIR